MNRSVLVVDRPSPFRDALLGALRQHGAAVTSSDDALDALARLGDESPDVVLVSDDAGAPGAVSVCRIVERKLQQASVYRLGEPTSRDALPTRSGFLPRSWGAEALAAALIDPQPAANATPCVDLDLGAAQLGELLLTLCAQRASGSLSLIADSHEREIVLLEGMPVHARSTHPSERLGALALRRGLITPDQLDAALRLARAERMRLGLALQRLALLDAGQLFELLAEQTREQLENACAAGASKARFRHDPAAADDCALFPVHPLTALIGAARRMPASVLSAALERASGRAIVSRNVAPTVERLLRTLNLAECLDDDVVSLGALRTAASDALGRTLHDTATAADALRCDAQHVALALVAGGVVRLGEPERVVRSGAPSLPPPPIGGGLVRALDSRAALVVPSLSRAPITPTTDAWGEALREHLHGSNDTPHARAYALAGAAAERGAIGEALLSAYLRLTATREPWLVLGVGFGASAARVTLAYHAQLDALDRSAGSDPSPATKLRMLELRRMLERARDALLNAMDADARTAEHARPESAADDADFVMLTSEAPARGAAPVTEAVPAPPPPPPAAPSAAVAPAPPPSNAAREALAELEPLVRQNNWQELLTRVEQKYVGGGETMPPGVALLYALAAKEAPPDATRSPRAAHADMIGIRAMSELLQVPEDSDTALVIAKRALRKRPIEWQKEPPRRFTIALMIIALVVGAAVGLFVNPGSLPW